MDGRLLLEGGSALRLASARRDAMSGAERVERLFDDHHRRLYHLALRLTRDAEEAHDLVQDTFLRAARRSGSIPSGAGPEEAWLVRVLVNRCRDLARRRAVRQRPLPALAPESGPSPESRAVARTTVHAALARLGPRRRAVVVLHEIEERPAREIARLLGIPAATVRWHLSRARRELRRLLTGPAGDGEETP